MGMEVNVNVHLVGLDWLHSALTTLLQTGEDLMATVKDFATKQAEYNKVISDALDGITEDNRVILEALTRINNSPIAISPEDETALQTALEASRALSEKAKALDDAYPPTPPGATPAEVAASAAAAQKPATGTKP